MFQAVWDFVLKLFWFGIEFAGLFMAVKVVQSIFSLKRKYTTKPELRLGHDWTPKSNQDYGKAINHLVQLFVSQVQPLPPTPLGNSLSASFVVYLPLRFWFFMCMLGFLCLFFLFVCMCVFVCFF